MTFKSNNLPSFLLVPLRYLFCVNRSHKKKRVTELFQDQVSLIGLIREKGYVSRLQNEAQLLFHMLPKASIPPF